MSSTALGAVKAIIFISDAHEKFYYGKLKEVRCQDVYHKALVYCLGISDDAEKQVDGCRKYTVSSLFQWGQRRVLPKVSAYTGMMYLYCTCYNWINVLIQNNHHLIKNQAKPAPNIIVDSKFYIHPYQKVIREKTLQTSDLSCVPQNSW